MWICAFTGLQIPTMSAWMDAVMNAMDMDNVPGNLFYRACEMSGAMTKKQADAAVAQNAAVNRATKLLAMAKMTGLFVDEAEDHLLDQMKLTGVKNAEARAIAKAVLQLVP